MEGLPPGLLEPPPDTVLNSVLVMVANGEGEPLPLVGDSVLPAVSVGKDDREPIAEGVPVTAPGLKVPPPSSPPDTVAPVVRVGVVVEDMVTAAGERDTPGVPVPPIPPPVSVFVGDWEAQWVEVMEELGEIPEVTEAGREEGETRGVPVDTPPVELCRAEAEGFPEPVALVVWVGMGVPVGVGSILLLAV